MSSKKYLHYSLLSASMFTLLAFAIINHFKVMTYIDNGLFNLLYDYHSPWLTGVMIGISNIHFQHRKSSHHKPTSHLTDTHLSPVK